MKICETREGKLKKIAVTLSITSQLRYDRKVLPTETCATSKSSKAFVVATVPFMPKLSKLFGSAPAMKTEFANFGSSPGAHNDMDAILVINEQRFFY